MMLNILTDGLFAISISFCVNYLLKSFAQFLTGLFVFLTVEFLSVEFWGSKSKWFLIDFLQPVSSLYIPLAVFFIAKVFNFDEVQFVSFFIYGSWFWCYTTNCLVLYNKAFLLKVLEFNILHFKYMTNLEWIFVEGRFIFISA